MSPAEELAKETISNLTFGLIPGNVSIIILAIWEVSIGLLFFSNMFRKFTIAITLLHMVLTFTPLFFFPELSFTKVPYGFTLVGQYIVKNIVFIAGLVILYRRETNS